MSQDIKAAQAELQNKLQIAKSSLEKLKEQLATSEQTVATLKSRETTFDKEIEQLKKDHAAAVEKGNQLEDVRSQVEAIKYVRASNNMVVHFLILKFLSITELQSLKRIEKFEI